MTVERLIAALRATGVEPDWRDLADVLWLARAPAATAVGVSGGLAPTVAGGVHPGDDDAPGVPHPPDASSRSVPDEPPEGPSPPSTGTRQRGVARASGTDPAGVPVEVRRPASFALPQQLGIARAVRPLRQTRRSRHRRVLDVERTVDDYCQTGLFVPVEVPARGRWFDDLALVVDGSPTMAVWDDTADELVRLLERAGVARRVTRWVLQDAGGGSGLVGRDGRARTTRELVDHDSRRLVLVLTDCVGPSWRSEAAWTALQLWGRHGPTAIVQVLPERLWEGTAMGPADLGLTSDRRGGPSATLQVALPWWWSSPERPASGVPVVSLDPERLAPWARMLMGTGVEVAGVAVPPEARLRTPSVEPLRSPAAVVDRFRSTVSAEAARLATMLSAVDVTLPVAHLLLRELLPHARLTHLAEVLVGGLLTRRTATSATFDFVPGVREELQRFLTTTTTFEVWRAVTPHLRRTTPGAAPFSILLGNAEQGNTDGSDRMRAVVRTLADRFGLLDPVTSDHEDEPPAPVRPARGPAAPPGEAEGIDAPADPSGPPHHLVRVLEHHSDGEDVLSWDYDEDGKKHYEAHGASRGVRHLAERIDQARGGSAAGEAVAAAITSLGDVVPPRLARALRRASTGQRQPTVILVTDLVHVPWDLLPLEPRDTLVSGTLGSRTSLTITPPAPTRAAPPAAAILAELVTIVVTPPGSGRPTPGATEEVLGLARVLGASFAEGTRSGVLHAVVSSDVVHLAVHGTGEVLGATGLHLGDGTTVTVTDLAGLRLERAPFIFVNAPHAAQLAPALLAAGASAVVAPGWRIDDRQAARIAELFYTEVSRGTTTAAALATVRTGLATDRSMAKTALAYRHFGSPFVTVVGLPSAGGGLPIAVRELAAEYNALRRQEPAGSERSEKMEAVVDRLDRTFATTTPDAPFDWSALLLGADRGLRLATYVWLQRQAGPTALGRLVHALLDVEDKPFGQYTALRSVNRIAAGVPSRLELPPEDVRGLRALADAVGWRTDRGKEIVRLLELVPESADDAPPDPEAAAVDRRIRRARAVQDATVEQLGSSTAASGTDASALAELAEAYGSAGRHAEALHVLQRLVELERQALDPRDGLSARRLASTLQRMAHIMIADGLLADALAVVEEALSLHASATDGPDVAATIESAGLLLDAARVREALGRADEAVRTAETALERLRNLPASDREQPVASDVRRQARALLARRAQPM